ncbi:two-component system, OmpR family, sensor histidine kinase BaeS [Roseateles sp. YR242]|uniref:ATP-binding protein n=1 Tax=Roseateles sp. YR242 TaxID=1855305 RepID=UPI0008C2D96D|nr:ATP-binding protein [Roseateles sp. YR242]SEL69713.1 two-component system, OmpR family, sensor histidine kinase BaeS [Roseateles sp. YR242]
MKRFGITTRVFLAVLAIAAFAVLAMGWATHLSFSRGFFGYLNEQQLARMESSLPRLKKAFKEHQSWEFVRDRPDVWFRLLGAEQTMIELGVPPPEAEMDVIASDLLGAGRRMMLLDSQRLRVIGFPFMMPESQERAIVVDGQTVGWLVIAPVQAATDEAALRFLGGQLKAVMWVGLAALVAAALVAWWVAKGLLAPVRRVAAATHRLAAGDYGAEVVVQGHDEVAQLGQDFNQLSRALARNEQMRRDFMADISHELRTPLAVLRGELEAIEDGVHPMTPELLQLLQTEVATLGQLVQDLHELALADAGALTYRKEDLDLVTLVAQEAQAFTAACEERPLRFEVVLPAGDMTVSADASRLHQLLHNLLDNSIRYTHPAGVLRLSLRRAGEDAVIDLEDSPPGVDPTLLPRLFERFFRVEGSRGRAGGGSGLGLAICRSIVEAHGGHILARPSSLGGIWIELRLPLTRRAMEGSHE